MHRADAGVNQATHLIMEIRSLLGYEWRLVANAAGHTTRTTRESDMPQRKPTSDEKAAATGYVTLRDVIASDLPIFFEHQQDPTAVHMAAFTARDPASWEAFLAHWTRILGDHTVTMKTVLFNGQVAGSVGSFEMFGKPQVTYWIGKEYWGQGLATRALSAFLDIQTLRPIYGSAARDNVASIRVLEKCGFKIWGYEKGFANARGQEIEEAILVLDAGAPEEAP
jgi:RimJ/RimL family protein N-acetyltransferase